MGLTESNQSKSGLWGLTKSKSTSHFAEDGYEGKPRQSTTLPLRSANYSLINNNNNTPNGGGYADLGSILHSTRPPDSSKRRERSLQRDHGNAKEKRVQRALTSQSADRKVRQSDRVLEFPDGSLHLTLAKEHQHDDRHDRVNPTGCVTPPNTPVRTSRHRPKGIYIPDENGKTNVRPKSRSRSRKGRSSSSCSQKEGNDVVSIEKETQTFHRGIPVTSSCHDNINGNYFKSTQTYPIPCEGVFDTPKSPGAHRKGKKEKAKVLSLSCSVPSTTTNQIESDPYICLHYDDSANRETLYTRNVAPPVLSEACLYIPNEINSPKTILRSPQNSKRSQIIIKVDNNRSESNNIDTVNGNSRAVKVCSNVWFEPSVGAGKATECNKCNENSAPISSDNSVNKVRTKSVNPKSSPSNNTGISVRCHDVLNRKNITPKITAEPNSSLLQSSKHTNWVKNKNVDKDIYNTSTNEACKHPFAINRSISLLDNLIFSSFPVSEEDSCDYENTNKQIKNINKDHESNNLLDEVQIPTEISSTTTTTTTTKTKIKSHSSFNDLTVVKDRPNSECNLLSKDPINPPLPVDISSNLTTCDAYLATDKATTDVLPEESISTDDVSQEENTNEQTNDINKTNPLVIPDTSCYPSCTSDFLQRATFPQLSPSYLQSVSNTITWNKDQVNPRTEMLRRKTIHNVDVGTFRVLRLPKLESQPKLVDVLRRKNEKNKPVNEDCNSELVSIDTIFSESEIDAGSAESCTQLNENSLKIVESKIEPCDSVESESKLVTLDLEKHAIKCDDELGSDKPLVDVIDACDIIDYNIIDSDVTSDKPLIFQNSDNAASNPELEIKDNADTKVSLPSSTFEFGNISGLPEWDEDPGWVTARVNRTLPLTSKEAEKVDKKSLSLKLRKTSSQKADPSNIDCNLTCHEQCQTVVSLDCKATTPDTESLVEEEDVCVVEEEEEDVALQNGGRESEEEEEVKTEVGSGGEGEKEEEEKEELKEEVKEEKGEEEDEEVKEVEEELEEELVKEEEEKHEEEMLEKEMRGEQEMMLTLRKQEVSTLRRTVHRIQSRSVDSAKIEEWVQKCPLANVGLQIAKESNGEYRGCLRIHLNLGRPINIVAGTRPPSIYDILQEDRTLEKTLTSFYMPRDAVKAIHITSKTTTREVIVALLRKFKVVDNPQKFALYERTYDTGQSIRAKLRRLSETECPLVLAIAWNAEGFTNKRLVLQENDTADIQWEAFSLPELHNFLRILDREEGEYKNQIRDKYALLRQRIQWQLVRIAPVNT